MNDVEADLVELYNGSPRYYSPLRDVTIGDIAAMVDVELVGPGLDLGCGDGRLAGSTPGALDGIDISETRVQAARATDGYRQLVVGDLYDLQVLPGPYETIYAIEVLEHLADPITVITMALDRLAPRGALLATVPLQLPGRAHLQVYDSVEDAKHRLDADRAAEFTVRRFRHAALAWEG